MQKQVKKSGLLITAHKTPPIIKPMIASPAKNIVGTTHVFFTFDLFHTLNRCLYIPLLILSQYY